MIKRSSPFLVFILAASFLLAADVKLRIPIIPSGEPINYQWSFQSLDHTTHTLSEFDNEILVISHWATWCGPCNAELPALANLYNQVKGHGVEVLCLTSENPDVVRRWLEKHPIDLPIYTFTGLPPDDLKLRAWPTAYIVNKQGYVIHREEGAAQWDDPGVVQKLLDMAR
jgi:thiol-disulfide isomerase/thioredoxin